MNPARPSAPLTHTWSGSAHGCSPSAPAVRYSGPPVLGATHLRATQSQIVCLSCKLAAAKTTEQNSQGERAPLAFLLMQALPLPQEAPEEAGRDAGCHKCKSFRKVVVCSVLGVCVNPVTRPSGECPVTVAQLMVILPCMHCRRESKGPTTAVHCTTLRQHTERSNSACGACVRLHVAWLLARCLPMVIGSQQELIPG